MTRPLIALSLLALAPLAHAGKARPAAIRPAAADLPALIECRAQYADFIALQPAVNDPLKAAALGWLPLPQANPFMTEFSLNAPITVFGQRTDRIAFSGESIIAVLDLPDPHPLAKRLQLETAVDTPQKAMFGREVRGAEVKDAKTGRAMYASAILNVSNVATHPGKTLAGCSYGYDAMDDAPAPAASGG